MTSKNKPKAKQTQATRQDPKSKYKYRYAVSDIGSNTVKINIYDIKGTRYKTVFSQSRPLGLASFVENGELSSEGLKALCGVLRSYKSMAKTFGAGQSDYIATASLRNISNSEKSLEYIKKNVGVDVKILSGEEEADLGFIGISGSLHKLPRRALCVDMGGGSTEFTAISNGKAVKKASIPIGALLLRKNFVSGILPTPSEEEQIAKYSRDLLETVPWISDYGEELILIGGTGRAVAKLSCVISDKEFSSGSVIYKSDFDKVFSRMIYPDKDDTELMIKLMPDRLHIIVPGMIAYRELISAASAKKAIVCFSGVRDGYIMRALSSEGKNGTHK